MWSEYDDGLGEAMADLNGAFGELSGFGETAGGVVKVVAPLVVGMGVSFGTVALLDYFIEDAGTRAKILPYKWLIGAGVGTIAGVIIWKTMGTTQGIIAISASALLALVSWSVTKLSAPSAAGYRAYEVRNPQAVYGAYQVQNPQAVYQGHRGLGEGTMVNLRGFGEGQMVDLATPGRSSVLSGAINPGVFG
jgi:hypothetical protein